MNRRAFWAGLAFTSPWLIGATVFLFLPMAMSAWYSLTDFPILKDPAFIGTANYRELLGDERFWLVVKNTAIYAVFSIPLATLISLVLAAMVSTPGLRLAGFYKAVIFIPTLVPMMASAMVWLWLFNGKFGLVNALLVALRVATTDPNAEWFLAPNWLQDDRFAMVAIIVTSLWGVGQSVVIYAAAMQEVPRELYEAAGIDGMSAVRRFVHITLPMISPLILFNVINLLIGTLQVFALPYVLFRDERGQRAAGDFYTLMLYDNAFVYQRMGYASAMAWIQMLAILVLTGIGFLLSRRLVHYRAG